MFGVNKIILLASIVCLALAEGPPTSETDVLRALNLNSTCSPAWPEPVLNWADEAPLLRTDTCTTGPVFSEPVPSARAMEIDLISRVCYNATRLGDILWNATQHTVDGGCQVPASWYISVPGFFDYRYEVSVNFSYPDPIPPYLASLDNPDHARIRANSQIYPSDCRRILSSIVESCYDKSSSMVGGTVTLPGNFTSYKSLDWNLTISKDDVPEATNKTRRSRALLPRSGSIFRATP